MLVGGDDGVGVVVGGGGVGGGDVVIRGDGVVGRVMRRLLGE